MSKRIAFSNFNDNITSYVRNDATVSRVWQLPNRSCTLAGEDIALIKATSGSDGIYPTASLHQIPVMNAGSTAFEMLNLGSVGSHAGDNVGRVLLPKGFVAINWSQNFVLNWKWNNALSRAEPFDTAYPMIGTEFGGEGFLVHYTKPGDIPATAFHEICRFGGAVEGLSGVNSLTTYVPFNQFKACIYAAYSSTTTPPAATDESWWGGTGNTLSSVLNPLLWLNTEEVKGSGYNLNELARFSAYNNTAYPAVNFEKSRGTYQTKTIATTDTIQARIGVNVYDGSSFENTAAISFVTRGTMANQAVGQSIVFVTSATDTTGMASRLEITHDGRVLCLVPGRYSLSTVSGIPSYTAATSLSPTPTATEYASFNQVSTANGGLNIVGLTNNTAAAFPLVIRGINGHASPTSPSVRIAASKTNGSTNFTDIAATEIAFQIANNATVIVETLGSGCTGFGATTPTAFVHCGASTTTRAGLRVVPGAAPSSPNNGDIWIDSTAHTAHIRINGVTKTITLT